MRNYLTINEMVNQAYQTAVEHGWHDEDREFGTIVALMHSELSEALEAFRKSPEDKMWDDITEEFADVVIRIFDACGKYGLNLEQAIINKMEKNKNREFKHGGKRI